VGIYRRKEKEMGLRAEATANGHADADVGAVLRVASR
jgi:hypothetical protein